MKISITELKIRSDAYSREYGVERSVGCHLMSVVERILERRPELQGGKRLDGDKYFDGDPTTESLRAAGFTWERAMSAHFSELHPGASLVFPGEQFWCMQCDTVMAGGNIGRDHCRVRRHRGIFFTPDYIIDDRKVWTIGEHKWTWLSSNRCTEDKLSTPAGIWKWPVQLMWGCFGFDTRFAHIEAMFCVGDYKEYGYWGEPRPQGKHIDLEFTEQEIRNNKMLIVQNAVAEGML